jgi:hypothetical protein
MFMQLYRLGGGVYNYQQAAPYLEAHPAQLAFLIDWFWSLRDRANFPLPPAPQLDSFPFCEPPYNPPQYMIIPNTPNLAAEQPLNHLIYAYCIENTRAYEIVEKVIFEFLHGEKLGFPRVDNFATARWLRATEELLYRGTSNYLTSSLTSNIRADVRASRRNAYYRLFGMDLNHGTGSVAQYQFQKPPSANIEFVRLFEEFLSEAWIGIMNATNTTGPNPTDDPKMRDLLRRIHELLVTRKQNGNLALEEFSYVSTMSWLHLTLYVNDAPVVQDMNISADSPGERLRQMGDLVGYPAHPKADAFFSMAEDISGILTCIEQLYDPNNINALPTTDFYAPNGALTAATENVITQWSIASGRDLKSSKVRSGFPGAPVQRNLAQPNQGSALLSIQQQN